MRPLAFIAGLASASLHLYLVVTVLRGLVALRDELRAANGR
jgi:hypothetical protein